MCIPKIDVVTFVKSHFVKVLHTLVNQRKTMCMGMWIYLHTRSFYLVYIFQTLCNLPITQYNKCFRKLSCLQIQNSDCSIISCVWASYKESFKRKKEHFSPESRYRISDCLQLTSRLSANQSLA